MESSFFILKMFFNDLFCVFLFMDIIFMCIINFLNLAELDIAAFHLHYASSFFNVEV